MEARHAVNIYVNTLYPFVNLIQYFTEYLNVNMQCKYERILLCKVYSNVMLRQCVL